MTRRGRAAVRGVAALELAILAPAVIVLALVAVFGGRMTQAESEVYAAAHSAARAGTLARTPAEAESAARQQAAATLGDHHVSCRQLTVTVDTASFRPGGFVSAQVHCTVDVADLAGLGLPGSISVSGSATSPIDLYRGTR